MLHNRIVTKDTNLFYFQFVDSASYLRVLRFKFYSSLALKRSSSSRTSPTTNNQNPSLWYTSACLHPINTTQHIKSLVLELQQPITLQLPRERFAHAYASNQWCIKNGLIIYPPNQPPPFLLLTITSNLLLFTPNLLLFLIPTNDNWNKNSSYS